MTFTPKTPPGCRSLEEEERALVATAEAAEQRAYALLEESGRIGVATANALLVTAVRARTQASRLAAERENQQRVDQRLRSIMARRGPARTPLRRKDGT